MRPKQPLHGLSEPFNPIPFRAKKHMHNFVLQLVFILILTTAGLEDNHFFDKKPERCGCESHGYERTCMAAFPLQRQWMSSLCEPVSENMRALTSSE